MNVLHQWTRCRTHNQGWRMQHCSLPISHRLLWSQYQRRIRGFRATGETRHVTKVSWELRSKVPPTKNWKVCGFGPLFYGRGQILCAKKLKHPTWEGRSQVWTGFLLGTFPSNFEIYWGNSPVNFKGQNPGGESFPLSQWWSVDTPMVNTIPCCVIACNAKG